MKSFLKFFSSVKLAIVLFLIIAIASILGTLIPQQRSLEEYEVRYGQLANLLVRLQLTKLYHSLWYLMLLFLFTLNIIICTLTRLSPKLQRVFMPRLEKEKKNILALKIKDSFKNNADLATTRDEISQLLISRHYRLQRKENEKKYFLLARKKILGWFGSDVIHLGLLVILAGGITSGIGGFRENLSFYEGQTLPVPQAKFQVRLDKFETELYPNESVKDWKSTLSVIKDGQSLFSKTIEVNHPLSYQGFSFYQSGYGLNWENPMLEIWVKKKSDASYLKKVQLMVGEKISFGDKELTQISVARFVPDFVIGEEGVVETRSLEPKNPAALVEAWKNKEKIFSGWIFYYYKDFARLHSGKESDLSFELKNFIFSEFSVIEVARDPGVNLIWLGSTILMIGLFLAFYWPAREFKVILEESQGKTEVIAGGMTLKNKEAFQSEFEKIIEHIKRKK